MLGGCLTEGSVVAKQPCVKSVVPVRSSGAGQGVNGYHGYGADMGIKTLYRPMHGQGLG